MSFGRANRPSPFGVTSTPLASPPSTARGKSRAVLKETKVKNSNKNINKVVELLKQYNRSQNERFLLFFLNFNLNIK